MFKPIALPHRFDRTIKLFHKDAYLKTATAKVLFIDGEHVVLDRTLFYAESGGQDFDTGTLGNVNVVDVQDQGGRTITSGTKLEMSVLNVDKIVVHKIEGTPEFQEDDTVELKLNWERRYRLMRNHSASHFLYHATRQKFQEEAGKPLLTKGCHITEDGARFDFYEVIPSEWVPEIQEVANTLINERREIIMEPEPLSSDIYYWRYRDDIAIPCGGTHVKSADELSEIQVSRKKQGKSITRIKFRGVSGE